MTITTLDVRGRQCPEPIVKAKLAIDRLRPGDVLEVFATDEATVQDFRSWTTTSTIALLIDQRTETDGSGGALYVHVLQRRP